MQRVAVFNFSGMLGVVGSKTVEGYKIQDAVNELLQRFPAIKILDIRICSDASPVSSPSEPHMGSVFEVFVIVLYEADDDTIEEIKKQEKERRRVQPDPSRMNDPCLCGSGKKHKNCCGLVS